MQKFINFDSPCEIVDVSLYDNLIKNLEYRTAKVLKVVNHDVSSIKFRDEDGSVINLARSTGTNKNNVRLLQESITNKGWDVRHIPPIIEKKSKSLFDGFSRHEGLLNKDHQKAPYLEVEIKEGFSIGDVIDEIGLGSNDHSQSVRATIKDFKIRLRIHFDNLEKENQIISKQGGIDWFDGIQHSFNDKQIEDCVTDVINEKKTKVSMESLDKKTAEKRVSDITKTPQKHVYAINKDNRKGSQYVHRLAGDIIDHFLRLFFKR